MLKTGFVGWRGMVGSVLMDRMQAENDFKNFAFTFFSTSQSGKPAPNIGQSASSVKDAHDIDLLSEMDIILSCQGGDYTSTFYPKLRANNWNGYWIDAASTLRMEKDAIIVLDPVNRNVIDQALTDGIKNYIGGNCTVSLMMMALGGLLTQNLVEWVTSMTYQSASGAGAANMKELVRQMGHIGKNASDFITNPASTALDLDRNVSATLNGATFPTDNFGAPLAASLIPWIDRPMENGQTREEWKGYVETNKILGRENTPIPIDGICVRIGAMRCHSQAFTIKLTRDLPLNEIEAIIADGNDWVKVIPNEKHETLMELSPAKVSGTLSVPIGRLHKLNIGPAYLTGFSVGDQLLWGAAEPLRRALQIIRKFLEP
ncbi:MAG: aspartate-semialdehyde dehydrogenase [Desulfobacteraceae bacterium]|nr:aspartate-semialdehyde dehydrogenase [Desulfobacteraceae bacterium]